MKYIYIYIHIYWIIFVNIYTVLTYFQNVNRFFFMLLQIQMFLSFEQ